MPDDEVLTSPLNETSSITADVPQNTDEIQISELTAETVEISPEMDTPSEIPAKNMASETDSWTKTDEEVPSIMTEVVTETADLKLCETPSEMPSTTDGETTETLSESDVTTRFTDQSGIL